MSPILDSAPAGHSPRWTVVDTILVATLTAVAGGLRLYHIAQPQDLVFDEFYAADACFYLHGPESGCRIDVEISTVHPPLGKWMIAIGIRLLGFTPAGWRLASLVAGTLCIAILYLLARRVLRSTVGAAVASGLLTFDFLHFVLSRTAMLDIFVVLFGLAAFLCVTYDRDRAVPEAAAAGASLRTRLGKRPWLLAAGLLGGAAVACKWSGVYLLAGVAALAVMHEVARRHGIPNRFRAVARDAGPPLLVALLLVPAAVYVISFAGRLDGTLLAWPWDSASWIHAFVARHGMMLEHHTGALYVHPYTSPMWSWPLLKRPVLFHFRPLGAEGYREIMALGNPLVWWSALLAFAVVTGRVLRRRHLDAPGMVAIVGFTAAYLPWLVITRQEAFLYYFLPAVPFLYLALAQLVTTVSRMSARATAIGILVVCAVAPFAFFRPLLVGSPMPYQQWERRMWFRDCGPPLPPGTPARPVTQPVPPPAGWCWI